MAKIRKLSANRMLLEFIENGIEAEKRKQQEFFDLAERFCYESDSEASRRSIGPNGFWRLMPKITQWESFPEGVRQHLVDRMRDRQSASPT